VVRSGRVRRVARLWLVQTTTPDCCSFAYSTYMVYGQLLFVGWLVGVGSHVYNIVYGWLVVGGWAVVVRRLPPARSPTVDWPGIRFVGVA